MTENVEISVVIPVYCSEKTLDELYERLISVLEKMGVNFEIIMVDDSSKDQSWNKLKELRRKDKRVRIIRLAKNFGQINAILCGFSIVEGKYIITMDDDLQHPPEEIPKFYHAILESPENDVILGKPIKKQHNVVRNLGTTFGNIMNTLYFKKPYSLKMFSFRLLKREIVDEMVKIKNPNYIFESTLLSMTNNIGTVIVEHHKRKVGKTTYTPIKLIRYALNQVFTDSFSPLKVFSILGIIVAFLCLSLGIYYLIGWYYNKITIDGWTSLIVSNLFLSGLILITLGIIGEYLIRIMRTISGHQYFINQKDI